MARAATLATALWAPVPALAADPAGPRSGFYVGGHVGYGFGNATATLAINADRGPAHVFSGRLRASF